METVAYYMALLVVVTVPGAILYWFLIHPFARFWRRLGAWPTFTLVAIVCLAFVAVIFRFREPLLAVRFGIRWPLVVLAAVVYAVAIWIDLERRKHLTFPILAGAPEVSSRDPGKLLTEGIYGRVRNPRYLSFVLGIAAWTLFTNYLAMWIVLVATFPALWLVVLLEERELRQRFGEEYEEYCRRVPRFLPRSGSG